MAQNRAERRRAEKEAKKQAKAAGNGSTNLDALMQQAQAMYQANHLPDTLKLLEQILALAPNRHDVASTAGLIAFDLADYEKSIKHYETAIAIEPGNVKAQFGCALALKSLGRFKEAAPAMREAVKLSNGAAEPVRLLIQILWQLGASVEIPTLCKQLLKHEPQNVEAAMHEALAHYHRGTPDEARDLLGFDDLVEIHDLEAPVGYDDLTSFNKALADYVVDHPTMAVPDKDHPTYHNENLHITRELVGMGEKEKDSPVNDLEKIISAKIKDYLARKKDSLNHPFFERWPEKNHMVGWGTLLKGKGNLASHIHLDGYLGMVYYPDLPDEMRSEKANSGEDTSGFLELGRPPEDFPVEVQTDVHVIQPKEGRLVIFPGYFFHRTIPFQSQDRRISIAFDIVTDK